MVQWSAYARESPAQKTAALQRRWLASRHFVELERREAKSVLSLWQQRVASAQALAMDQVQRCHPARRAALRTLASRATWLRQAEELEAVGERASAVASLGRLRSVCVHASAHDNAMAHSAAEVRAVRRRAGWARLIRALHATSAWHLARTDVAAAYARSARGFRSAALRVWMAFAQREGAIETTAAGADRLHERALLLKMLAVLRTLGRRAEAGGWLREAEARWSRRLMLSSLWRWCRDARSRLEAAALQRQRRDGEHAAVHLVSVSLTGHGALHGFDLSSKNVVVHLTPGSEAAMHDEGLRYGDRIIELNRVPLRGRDLFAVASSGEALPPYPSHTASPRRAPPYAPTNAPRRVSPDCAFVRRVASPHQAACSPRRSTPRRGFMPPTHTLLVVRLATASDAATGRLRNQLRAWRVRTRFLRSLSAATHALQHRTASQRLALRWWACVGDARSRSHAAHSYLVAMANRHRSSREAEQCRRAVHDCWLAWTPAVAARRAWLRRRAIDRWCLWSSPRLHARRRAAARRCRMCNELAAVHKGVSAARAALRRWRAAQAATEAFRVRLSSAGPAAANTFAIARAFERLESFARARELRQQFHAALHQRMARAALLQLRDATLARAAMAARLEAAAHHGESNGKRRAISAWVGECATCAHIEAAIVISRSSGLARGWELWRAYMLSPTVALHPNLAALIAVLRLGHGFTRWIRRRGAVTRDMQRQLHVAELRHHFSAMRGRANRLAAMKAAGASVRSARASRGLHDWWQRASAVQEEVDVLAEHSERSTRHALLLALRHLFTSSAALAAHQAAAADTNANLYETARLARLGRAWRRLHGLVDAARHSISLSIFAVRHDVRASKLRGLMRWEERRYETLERGTTKVITHLAACRTALRRALRTVRANLVELGAGREEALVLRESALDFETRLRARLLFRRRRPPTLRRLVARKAACVLRRQHGLKALLVDASKRGRTTALMQTASEHIRWKRLSTGLGLLRSATREIGEVQRRRALADAHDRRVAPSKALLAWQRNVLRQLQCRKATSGFAFRSDAFRLRHVLSCLHRFASHAVSVRARSATAAGRLPQRTTRVRVACLARWALYASECVGHDEFRFSRVIRLRRARERRDVLAALAKSVRHSRAPELGKGRRLRRAMGAWGAWSRDEAQMGLWKRLGADARHSRRKRDAWETWLSRPPRLSPDTLELSQLFAHGRRVVRLRSTLRHWHEHAASRRVERMVEASTALLIRMRWWRWWASSRARAGRLASFGARIWFLVITRRKLRRWRAFAISRGDESEAAVALLGPLRHRHVALAFDTWLSAVVWWVRGTRQRERAEFHCARLYLERGLMQIVRQCVRTKHEVALLADAHEVVAKRALMAWAQWVHEVAPVAAAVQTDARSALATRFWKLRQTFRAFALLVERCGLVALAEEEDDDGGEDEGDDEDEDGLQLMYSSPTGGGAHGNDHGGGHRYMANAPSATALLMAANEGHIETVNALLAAAAVVKRDRGSEPWRTPSPPSRPSPGGHGA